MKSMFSHPMFCPLDPRYICPLSLKDSNQMDEAVETASIGHYGLIGQREQDINRIIALVDREFSNYYSELQRYKIQREMTRLIFRSIVSYVLRNEQNYKGTVEQKTPRLLNALRRDNYKSFNDLRRSGVPNNRINQIFMDIIRFTLRNIRIKPAPAWSEWEDLGGVLTSAPAVSSWQANRVDVFARGQNLAMWHKYWSATRWSDWEDIGGSFTSAPAAVSWSPNRIDIFGRGQNQNLWHKYWDTLRWGDWEDLGGGPITSGPAAASTGVNRLEVFARGQENQLLFRTWNGSRWTQWQSLGGIITSEPAAVSWGGNRLDVFARGQNNHLWHIWRA